MRKTKAIRAFEEAVKNLRVTMAVCLAADKPDRNPVRNWRW